MDAGGGRVHAPEDDQLRVRIVLVDDAGHLSVQRLVRGAGGSGADRGGQARRAEAAPQLRVVGVLRQQAVRPAVIVGKDGFGAGRVLDLRHPPRDQVERLVPGDARERALSLRALPDGRIQHAVFAVDALVEAAHLRADEVARDRILVAAVDLLDAAVLDRDVERAGIGTVERARGADGRMSPGVGRSGAGHGQL